MFRVKFRALMLLLTVALACSTAPIVRSQEPVQIQGTDKGTSVVGQGYLQKYLNIAALALSERREAFIQATAVEKSALWRVHLALSLARLPELQAEQQRIILDSISLASPELFTITSENPAWRAKVDGPLQLLRQRALKAFPRNEAARILANISDDEVEVSLLRKYIGFSEQSLSHRKELFAKAGSMDRTDLWRVHLALNLACRPSLNEAQREVLMNAMSLASPEFFSLSSENPLWKAQVDIPLQALNKRAVAVFSKNEGGEIFGTLGTPEPGSLDGLEPEPDPNQKCQCSHDSPEHPLLNFYCER